MFLIQQELRNLIDSISPSFTYAKDLIRHNLVVFRNGDGALQVLPSLIDVLPEAKLNLVIYHLKNGIIIKFCFNLKLFYLNYLFDTNKTTFKRQTI